MKIILRLNEFISAKGLEQAKKTDDPYYLIWANGKIIFNPSAEDRMSDPSFFMGINMMIRPKDKQVKLSPMDDWSDIKIIKRVQQALSDLKKTDIISSEWDCIIGDATNTKRSLGSSKVEDIIRFNSHFTDVIPFAFHGTSSYYLENIKENGILPRSKSKSDPNWKMGYTEKSPNQIYMTIDFDRAAYYASTSVDYIKTKGIKSVPVVIVVKDMSTKYVITDDDYKTNMGMLQLLQSIHHGVKAKVKKHQYIAGIRNSSQFAISKVIKPNLITDIIYPENE